MPGHRHGVHRRQAGPAEQLHPMVVEAHGRQVAPIHAQSTPGCYRARQLHARVAVGHGVSSQTDIAAGSECGAQGQPLVAAGLGATTRGYRDIALVGRSGRSHQSPASPVHSLAVEVHAPAEVGIEKDAACRAGQAGAALVADLPTVKGNITADAQAAVDRDHFGVGVLANHQSAERGRIRKGKAARTGHASGVDAHPIGTRECALHIEGMAKVIVPRADGQHASGVDGGSRGTGVDTPEVDAVADKGDIATAGVDGEVANGGVDVPAVTAVDIGLAGHIKVTPASVESAAQIGRDEVVPGACGAITHRQAVPGHCIAPATKPDMATVGAEGAITTDTDAALGVSVVVGPHHYVQLARASTAGGDVIFKVDPSWCTQRQRRVTTTGFADDVADRDAGRELLQRAQADVAIAGNGQRRRHRNPASIRRDRARHCHRIAGNAVAAVDVDIRRLVGGLANRQAGHGLAILVPVEPPCGHVLPKRIGKRCPRYITTGADFGLFEKAVTVKTDVQIPVFGKAAVGSVGGADPILGVRIDHVKPGARAAGTGGSQQVQRPAVGDQAGRLAHDQGPFVAVAIQRDATACAAGHYSGCATCTFIQANAIVVNTTQAGVFTDDGDGVRTGIG